MDKPTRVFLALAMLGVGVALGSIIRSAIDGTWDLVPWQVAAGLWAVTGIVFVRRQHRIAKES